MTRLETISPQVASLLRQADPEKRKLASIGACEVAVRNNRISEPPILSVLQTLRSGGVVAADDKNQLASLCQNLDDAYFSLQEEVDQDSAREQEALVLFSRARICSAVSFAANSEVDGPAESIYEAALSVDSRQTVLDHVISILE